MKRAIGAGVAIVMLSVHASAQAPPPAEFPGKPPVGPPADIVRFEAKPDTIEPGESATLEWVALNTYSLSIEPDLGAVATRGARRVSPRSTTTYTLTVTGTGGAKTQSITVTVAGTAAAPTPRASPSREPSIPRLADGKPDLSGVYIGGRDINVGAVRLREGADRFRVAPRPDDLGAGVDCLPPGVPAAITMPFPLQIVHKPDVVAIMYEAYHLFRIIPIGRDHSPDLDPAWMGHSVARWDGETLVVDVRGFNDKTLVGGSYRHTEDMRVTERFRRTSYGTIAYEATVEDPTVFAAPVTYGGNLTLRPEWELGEYVCAENNKSYQELFENKASESRP